MPSRLTRTQAIDACCTSAEIFDFALFAGNGYTARCAASGRDCSGRFFMVGSMGHCATLAAGFSRCSGVGTIAIEGDGNALMGLSGFPVAASASKPPFIHVVLDNGVYETTGRQLTLSSTVDFPAIALGVGYDTALKIAEVDEIHAAIQRAKKDLLRTFLYVPIEPHGSGDIWPRVPFHPKAIARKFSESRQRTVPTGLNWTER